MQYLIMCQGIRDIFSPSESYLKHKNGVGKKILIWITFHNDLFKSGIK